MVRWRWILGSLILLCIVLGAALLRHEPPNGHGLDHPRLATMQQGGNPSRHEGVLWLGWLYGILQLVLFVKTLTLGLRKGRAGQGAILAIGAAAMAVFSLLILVYHKHMYTTSADMFGGYPLSTALMLFVLWPLPALFIVLYIVKFDSWFLAPEDVARVIGGNRPPPK